ncbi:FtsB family cell division protein [Pontibacillus litoralis]|uniref:Cell division protein n=1 Tax=Pontibacillus litoralis JSM 072002 TaxID=1385512 RepID=A0A0A5G302_9BACI|nr:septum formation initiator family protein [Pontibacillus litoralis]KGX85488.1 cell division protein [Pontibacillus litoralis JSM 072002]
MKGSRKRVTKIDSGYMKQYDAYVERQQRKKKRLVRRLVLFTIVAFLLFGGLLAYHINQRNLYAEKQKKYEELQKEMEQLEQQEEDLRDEIKLLKDDEYVLQIARKNYFFSKEGEIIFKLPEDTPSY